MWKTVQWLGVGGHYKHHKGQQGTTRNREKDHKRTGKNHKGPYGTTRKLCNQQYVGVSFTTWHVNPHYVKDKAWFERVQYRFERMFPELKDLRYLQQIAKFHRQYPTLAPSGG